jgi:hypothetical protein
MNSKEELSMDELTLKEVLIEILEDHKGMKSFMEDQQQSINDRDRVIKDLITGFEQKFANLKNETPKPDLSEVNSTLNNGLTEINQTLQKKPVPVTKQVRFLLFPETNAERYYKITFGRILPWLAVVLMATYLFSLGQQWISEWQMVKEEEFETNISATAWDSLYKKANAKDKKTLDKLWEKNSQTER